MLRLLTQVRIGFCAASLLLCCAGSRATAQAKDAAQPPTCTPADTRAGKPCPPPDHDKTVSEQFPFPGEAPEVKTPASPAPVPDAPGIASPGGSKPVKDQFPYPGEPAGGAAADPDLPGAPAGSSSSSSSSSGSPADPANPTPDPASSGGADASGKPGLKDEGSEGSTARSRRRRLRPQAQKVLSDDERVDEDLSVASFYQKTGNLNGAHMRASDAVKIQPNEPDAHFALARIADKMGKKDEAIAEYKAYLQLDPDGEEVKAARKALEKLQR